MATKEDELNKSEACVSNTCNLDKIKKDQVDKAGSTDEKTARLDKKETAQEKPHRWGCCG